MQARLFEDDPLSLDTPLLAVGVFEGDDIEGDGSAPARIDERLNGAFARAVEAGDFRGGEEDFLLLYDLGTRDGGLRRFLFVGMGERDQDGRESLRKLGARAVRQAESLRLGTLAIVVPGDVVEETASAVQAAAEGAVLAAWDFRELRSTEGGSAAAGEARPLVEEVVLCAENGGEAAETGLAIGVAFAEGENLARVLQWRPGNIATPTHLAEVALGLADTFGFDATILGPSEMEAEGMRALLAVSAGSDEEPRLIVLEHRGGAADDPPVALVGKGLTFDSGGISIKPSAGMEDMKYDMSGGAAVLGAMHAVGSLGLGLNVVAVVPSSENLLSGSATKPGDVIRTRAGKTVEVINTDAEGRLILADALSYVVDRYSPAAVVDCATLTGACVVALGNQAAALLGNDDALLEEVRGAGDRAWERCWPLPLWKEYAKQLESPVADLKNVGGRPAGTITAGWFLSEFVGEAKWAHLDIAGTAYGEPRAPYHRKGGFGFPTRLLLEWLRGHAR